MCCCTQVIKALLCVKSLSFAGLAVALLAFEDQPQPAVAVILKPALPGD